ncbi:hypothetical protein BYT27DRAFT_7247288 [Phlegmacium glaucopus]|nr:hypothetical protein BYT27DRAFT_7247288 [Phlegmacium glaucopus]
MTTTANLVSPSAESTTNKGPKKVEVSLPGPSPKRPRHDTDEPTKAKEPRKAKKATHGRSASSISSMNRFAESSGDASTTKKPLSARKPQSKTKSVTAEDDDNVSVAGSSISVKIRRNEAERIEYFQNQPECGEMEPHHVQCLRCGKSVNLGRKQTYTVRPWEIHRARCDQKQAQTVEASPTAEKVVAEAALDTSFVTASPISESYVARRQTEAERKAYLESDKQAETVEQGRVRCRKCQTWIILSDKQAFSTGKWVKHKSRCSDIVPSNRVAAAKRKLLVVNDPQAKSFDARRIECTFCGMNVVLQGEGDFNLTSWDEHKAQCTRSVPIVGSESVNSITFPRQFSQTPPSPASTENTLFAPESAPLGTSQSLKRNREEPEATVEDTKRPTVRPRTESYAPPETEAPSPLGWFLLPFQSFARGFRESLKNGS